jgi:Family of unknown function (DUF6152)
MNIRLCSLLLAGALASLPAQAHHSFATFDVTKLVTLVGTVKEFQWTNPHTWIFITVPKDGGAEDWEIEGGPVIGLKRDGWSKDSIKAGDKITLVVHPKRDGSHGGSFLQATTADGKVLGHLDTRVFTETATPPAQSPDKK